MNLSRIFDALPRTRLSQTLTQHAAGNAAPNASGRDWVRIFGDIAWQACVRYRHGLLRAMPAPGEPDSVLPLQRDDFAPADPYTREFTEMVMLRAMIAVAANDDHFTDERRMSVLQRICELELSIDERMFLMQEIQQPLAIEQLARYGRTTHAATGIYAASLFTADLSTSSAMLYLTALADALALSPALVAQIHRCAEQPNVSAPDKRFPDRYAKPAML
ncbi:MAG: DUF533 domain-containing protein [Gammaproteobacteria bacterium]